MRHFCVDRVVELEPGVRAVGVKSVALSEDFFADHFPGNPILPGVYLLEGLAQTAGVLLYRTTGGRRLAVLASVERIKFIAFARPGDQVRLDVQIDSLDDRAAHVRGSAKVGDQSIAAAAMTFLLLEPDRFIPPVYRPLFEQAISILCGEYLEAPGG